MKMIPEAPLECRRQCFWLHLVSLLPPVSCVILLLADYWLMAGTVFTLTFSTIAYGTLTPSNRWFGSHVTELPEEQAKEGMVWLTLDDGPHPETTPLLLDLLDRYEAKAGFFLIGDRSQKYPELVKEIQARGHLIGNHSQTHPAHRFWSLRPGAMWNEIAGCQQTLTGILGEAPQWFRPPVGHHNLFVRPVLKALGLTMAMWNCRGFDGVEKRADVILKRVSQGLKAGCIILLHDTTPVCVEVLEGTLMKIRERGLKCGLPTFPVKA